MERAILVHYAEIGLKGGNRRQFTRRLSDRLRQGLENASLAGKVVTRQGHLRIQPPDGASLEPYLAVATRIPGVANAAICRAVPPEIGAIQQAAVEALRDAPPGSFKIESRRGDKRFPMNSIQLSQAVGGCCAVESGRAVDVHDPDVTVRVRVTKECAYVSAATVHGPGGLPVGSTTHLLAFLSGGLDSPVAAWKMLRRGARVTAVHFHNRTFQGAAVLEKIEDLGTTLAWAAGRLPLMIVPFEGCQRAIVATVPDTHRMIVYRRAMFRIAARIAAREHALGYVTGDSLGQVASQTAENLRTIYAAANLPVYAPLVGSDKSEIVAVARRIGTYATSIRPHDDCCSFLIAARPAVKSTLAQVEAMEAGIDWDGLVETAVEGTTRQVLRPDRTSLLA